jgi:hypothetical protein
MSIWTGPYTSIKAAGTPATSATAMTSFMAKGNSLKLMVTTAGGGGAGTLTITAFTSPDKETTYYQVVDRDSVWSMTSSVINTAGSYELALEGLAVVPGQYVKLYYACTNAAGTIAIAVDNWENPAGSIGVDVGDVVVDLDTVNTNTATIAGDTTSINTNTATIAGDTTSIETNTATIAGDTTSIEAKVPALGPALMAGASPVTIATDDVVSTATGIHDVAAAAKLGGFRLLGNATSALQTAVSAANDDVKINTDLSGQLRLASHTIA